MYSLMCFVFPVVSFIWLCAYVQSCVFCVPWSVIYMALCFSARINGTVSVICLALNIRIVFSRNDRYCQRGI